MVQRNEDILQSKTAFENNEDMLKMFESDCIVTGQKKLLTKAFEDCERRKNGCFSQETIGLASDDVKKLSNAWQRGKLVLNKDRVPYKSMLGKKVSHWAKLSFLRGEVWTVLTTSSQLSASHFKRYRGSDKCGAVFRSIDDLPACFCMGRWLCLEPILPVATPVAGLWRSTCKPYGARAQNYISAQWKHKLSNWSEARARGGLNRTWVRLYRTLYLSDSHPLRVNLA